jgi:hypothetical protein
MQNKTNSNRLTFKLIRRIWRVYPVFRLAVGKGVDSVSAGTAKKYVFRLIDLLRWYLRYGEVLHYYYIFGFERKSHKQQDEYLSWVELDRIRESINRILVNREQPQNYRILTFDKFAANNYLNYLGIPCVTNEALIKNGYVVWQGGMTAALDSLFTAGLGVLFLKPVDGWGGTGVIRADAAAGTFRYGGESHTLDELGKVLKGKIWVVQKEVKQHPEINRISPKTVNTMRIITILKDHKPVFLTSTMRLAAGDSIVDNWDKGSISVGIDYATGTLMADGYLKPKGLKIGKCLKHPDTNIELKGFVIPFYKEAVDMCLNGHEYHYGTFMVGWDVAITPEGPIIIEVNCEPTLHAQQLAHGGLRRQIKEIEASYISRDSQVKRTLSLRREESHTIK